MILPGCTDRRRPKTPLRLASVDARVYYSLAGIFGNGVSEESPTESLTDAVLPQPTRKLRTAKQTPGLVKRTLG